MNRALNAVKQGRQQPVKLFQHSLLALAITAGVNAPASAALLEDTVALFDVVKLEVDDPENPDKFVYGSDAVALPGGQFAVVWSEAGQDILGRIRLQRFNASGQTVGAALTLYQQDAVGIDAAIKPVVAADDAGNMIVVWEVIADLDDFDGTNFLMASRVSAGNVVQALPSSVLPTLLAGTEDDIENDDNGFDVAMDSDGDFALAWWQGEEHAGFKLNVQTYLSDGSKMARLATDIASEFGSSVIMPANNRLVLTWAEGQQSGGSKSGSLVMAQSYSLSNSLGSVFRLDNFVNSDFQDMAQVMPDLAADSQGGFAAVWMETDRFDIDSANTIITRGQRWNADGSAGTALMFGRNELPSDTNAFSTPSLGADSDGNLLAAWVQDSGIHDASLAQATAFTGSNELIGQRQFDYAGFTQPLIGYDDINSGSVVMSDEVIAIIWSDYGFRLQARVMPGIEKKVVAKSSSGSGGSAGWLLIVLAGLFGWMRVRRQHRR